MTPRPPHAWTRRAALASLFAGASLFTMPGCDPRTLIFFLQPYDPVVPAPGPSLKGKKVVVLVHVSPGAGSDYSDLTRELSREVTTELRKSVKKITVVAPEKVATWVEAHPTWTDPSEAAKALEADMALFLDVSKFDTEDPRSPGLMEGNSSIHIQLWEMAYPQNSRGYENKSQPKESTNVYNEQADTTFPVRGPIPKDTGISPSSFRIKFLKLAAKEITWHFVDHEPADDVQDVKFNPNDKN
jgi:hypothetical protein